MDMFYHQIQGSSSRTQLGGTCGYQTPLTDQLFDVDEACPTTMVSYPEYFANASPPLPAEYYSPVSPPAQNGAEFVNGYMSNYGGPSQLDALNMDYHDVPVQTTWTSGPSQMPMTHFLSNGYDNVANTAHAPVAIGLPIYTGACYDASPTHAVGDTIDNLTGSSIPVTADFDFADLSPVSSPMYALPPSANAKGNHQPTASSSTYVMYNPPSKPSSMSLQTRKKTERRRVAPFSDSDADQLPSRTVREKRHIEDGYDEGPSTKRHRQTSATELPTYDGSRRPPDPLTGPVLIPAAIPNGRQLSNKTLTHTDNIYKTVDFEEEEPRDRHSLATISSANLRPSVQRSQPAKSGSNATARQELKIAGRGRSTKKAATSTKSVGCTWPVCIATGDKGCHERFGRQHDMLRHIRSVHLHIPLKCHQCGTYVLRELRAHQGRPVCKKYKGDTQSTKDERGWGALGLIEEAMGVIHGGELSDADIRSLVEAVRPLINAGRSRSTDIEGCIDRWMRENGWAERGWQRMADIRWTHTVSS